MLGQECTEKHNKIYYLITKHCKKRYGEPLTGIREEREKAVKEEKKEPQTQDKAHKTWLALRKERKKARHGPNYSQKNQSQNN